MKFSTIVCANPVALLRIPLPGEKLGIVDISRCRHWSVPFFVLEDDFLSPEEYLMNPCRTASIF